MSHPDSSNHSKHRTQWWFFLIALALYLPGIWWGLPQATSAEGIFGWGSDEIGPLGPLAEFYNVLIATDPVFNGQYTLLPYAIQALLIGPYLLLLLLSGGLAQPGPEFPFGLIDPVRSLEIMMLMARITTLLMAACVVVVAQRTGEILWGRIGGLLSGTLVLLMYPMFYYARTSNVDIGALLWTALGFAVFASCLRHEVTTRRLLWLGLFAGLATASKDASYAPFLTIAISLVWLHLMRQRGSGESLGHSVRPLWAGFFSGVASYVLATGMWLEPARYIAHVSFVINASAVLKYPATLSGSLGLLSESAGHLVASLGLPATITGLLGLAVTALRAPLYLLLALPALAIYTGIIMPVHFVNFRYLLVIAYLLALFAAGGLVWMLDTERRSIVRMCGVALLVIACGWSGLRAADLTWQMLTDSRYQVSDWLTKYARSGDRVGYFGGIQKLPQLPAGIKRVPMEGFCDQEDWGPSKAPEFILLIPVQHFEIDHEWSVPGGIYPALVDGTLGYHRVMWTQSRSLFSKRPVPFVNPPVQVFMRSDKAVGVSVEDSPDSKPGAILAGIENRLGLEYKVPPGLERNPEVVFDQCIGKGLSD